ncbi:MAG: hypothetical protein Q8M92_01840 [Candidatus Subteraquimicrobiales bacterium]|nr:hypothetical protein [Candidatus Subteraquimicrobiales bacterium]
MKILRHGDILLKKLAEGEISLTGVFAKDDAILEYGELTGHAHRLVGGEVQVYKTPGVDQAATYVIVKEDIGADLIHEEHDLIHLEPGTYEVVRQREHNLYSRAAQNVRD